MPTTAGLLRPAIRWSWICLAVGVGGWILFVGWTFGVDESDIPSRIHRLTSTSLAMLVLGSLAVQLAARMILWQRRLREGQREILARLDRLVQTEPLPPLRAVASVAPVLHESPTAPPQVPDNVRSFELGRQVGRKERDH